MSEDFANLVFAARPEPPVDQFAKRATFWVVAAILVLLLIGLLFPLLRFPAGPAHAVTGVVESVGFTGRGRLSATVRLNNGSLVLVRVPTSVHLSAGVFV